LLAFAAVCVLRVHTSLEPVPVFQDGQRDFVREPVVLSWKQNPLLREILEEKHYEGPVLYHVQSASNTDFNERDIINKPKTDGNTTYDLLEDAVGVRWWRVRPEDEKGEGLTTQWSPTIATTFYPSAFRRIKETKKLRVYVSNSINQGIFKYVSRDGELSGAEIRIAERVAEALKSEMGVEKFGKVTPTPVTWNELLDQPAKGTADLIISSISKSNEREYAHNLKFSLPYFCTGQSILYRTGTNTAAAILDSLRGKTIGYQENTSSERLIEALLSERGQAYLLKRKFRETENLVQALRNKNSGIDFVLTDTPFALDASIVGTASTQFESKELSQEDYPASLPKDARYEHYAIGVSQAEPELLNVVDGVIANMRDNGVFKQILENSAASKFPNVDPAKRARLVQSTCPKSEQSQ
jgi:ABC-type amino acid transport substrate-binding protein